MLTCNRVEWGSDPFSWRKFDLQLKMKLVHKHVAENLTWKSDQILKIANDCHASRSYAIRSNKPNKIMTNLNRNKCNLFLWETLPKRCRE